MPPPTGVAREPRYAPDRLIVKYRAAAPQAACAALEAQFGAERVRYLRSSGAIALRLPPGKNVDAVLGAFRASPHVEYAVHDHYLRISVIPNDPEFEVLWAWHNEGQTFGKPDADIDAPEGWDIRTDASEVIVAVIDTGVDYTHEDLWANIWVNLGEIPGNGIDDDGNGFVDDYRGYNFCSGANPGPDPMDEHGHGTHVAGIIGAMGNNDVGVCGVAWSVRIMPLRFMDASGQGLESDAAAAIEYAVMMGAHILNNSYGGPDYSEPLLAAIQYANSAGVLFVAAAGNDGLDNELIPSYPANYDVPNVISVAATDNLDQICWFSNYSVNLVHVAAPGDGLYSTWPGNDYAFLSGTSMSAPVVCGVAALVKAHEPGLSLAEWRERVIWTGDPLPTLQDMTVSGLRVNLFNALTSRYAVQITTPYNLPTGRRNTLYSCQLQAKGGTPPYTWSWEAGQYVEYEIENKRLGRSTGARGWHGDNATWLLALPFPFPFYGQTYESVYVCTNGFVDFRTDANDEVGDEAMLMKNCRIAVYWADLRTESFLVPGADIYVHQPDADSICIRWLGEDVWLGMPVDFELVLHRDGRIEMNYGPGNVGLWPPVIGISAGDEVNYALSLKHAAYDLHWAPTSVWAEGRLPPGLTLGPTDGRITGTPTEAGTFCFAVRADDSADSFARKSFRLDIDPDTGPLADFCGEPRIGAYPLTVNFTDASTGNITAWNWNFGDGTYSTRRNPSHTYTDLGNYTVSLTVTGPEGTHTRTKLRYILVQPPAPEADFDAEPRMGPVPLTVSFTDRSKIYDEVLWRLWDFGDGGWSELRNPVHTYYEPGVYTVSLFILEWTGLYDIETKVNYIVALRGAPPTADFYSNITEGDAPLAVQFSDNSYGAIYVWRWDFGDGKISYQRNPKHTYTQPGWYTVTLTVDGPEGMDTCTKTNYIHVTGTGGETFTLNLNAGWNLVSIPVEPNNPARDSVFPPTQVLAVYEYDQASGYVQPTTIHTKKGYWVYVSAPTTVEIVGVRPIDTSVAVLTGWNLIGVVGPSAAQPWQPLPSNPPCTAIWRYLPPYRVPTDRCDEGCGFWVMASTNATLWP